MLLSILAAIPAALLPLAASSQIDEARQVGLDLLRVHPHFSVSRFVETHAFKDPAKRRLFGEHLRQAGLPE